MNLCSQKKCKTINKQNKETNKQNRNRTCSLFEGIKFKLEQTISSCKVTEKLTQMNFAIHRILCSNQYFSEPTYPINSCGKLLPVLHHRNQSCSSWFQYITLKFSFQGKENTTEVGQPYFFFKYVLNGVQECQLGFYVA